MVLPFLPDVPVEPVWLHWRPRVGLLPIGEAHGARQCGPSTSAICTLGQNLARCPRTTLEVGWWLRVFRWASSMVLVQQAHHCHVAPCVVCVLGLSHLVVLAAARRLPWPTQFGYFPRKDALDARLPPPASRHAQSRNGSHDLSVAKPTLGPVELTGGCVCVCVRACVCACARVCVCVCERVHHKPMLCSHCVLDLLTKCVCTKGLTCRRTLEQPTSSFPCCKKVPGATFEHAFGLTLHLTRIGALGP